MARLQKWTLAAGTSSGGDPMGEVIIYGRTENWNFFFETAVTDELTECKSGRITQTKEPKTHNRRGYPGDPTGTSVEHTGGRNILTGVPRRSGNALPGRTLILMTDPETWDGGAEKRQFQYVGKWKDLYLQMESDAGKDIIAVNHTGTRYRICEETGDATQLGAMGTDLVRAR